MPDQLKVEETPEGGVVVRIEGELDKFASEAVHARLMAMPLRDPLVVDLGELTFVDSAGLHTLFAVARSAAARSARLAFVLPADSPVRRVLEIVHLDGVAPVCETVEIARDAAREPNLG